MHNFKCPDGHEFEAKRNFYAHCPVCGKNSKRVYDAKDDPPVTEVEPKTDETPTPEPPKEAPKKEAEIKPVIRPVRRVKVEHAKPVEKEDTETPKIEPPKTSPAKKVKIKRGAAPIVSKKIVTTRDRKVNKEKKEERATHWTRVKAFKLF